MSPVKTDDSRVPNQVKIRNGSRAAGNYVPEKAGTFMDFRATVKALKQGGVEPNYQKLPGGTVVGYPKSRREQKREARERKLEATRPTCNREDIYFDHD